jgi:sugar (pentulose or hexulose) kinase
MLLALDLGSTFLKGALCDAAGTPLRRFGVRLVYTHPAPDRVELPVATFDRAVTELLTGLRLDAPPTAIAITSQAQTFAVFGADGAARTPFISWQDTSAGAAHQRLAGDPRLGGLADHSSFTDLHPQQMLCQVARLAEQCGIGATDRLVPLPTRLIELLGGDACLDGNLAAMTGLYSLTDDAWWPAALATCGLHPVQLPRLVPAGGQATVSGMAGVRFGLTTDTPVLLAGNDQSAGASAAGVQRGGCRLIGLGTAQVAYRWLPGLPPPVPGLVRGRFPGGGAYLMAVDEIGGNSITWAAESLGRSADELLRLARAAPAGSRGLRFIAESGTGAGSWSGEGADQGPGERGRAVVEHLADRMAGRLDALGGDGPLLVSGAEDKADWCAILAQRLGRPLQPVAADPLLGAARMLVDHR